MPAGNVKRDHPLWTVNRLMIVVAGWYRPRGENGILVIGLPVESRLSLPLG